MKERFNDSMEMLNFAPSEAPHVHINKFVEETTKDRIKDFLSSDSIEPETLIILVNAVFFQGFWESEFDKSNTHKSIFYEHGRMPVSVNMMTQTGYFNYGIIHNG